MTLPDLPDVPELCYRLYLETGAQAVLVCGPEGQILGHAGAPAELDQEALDAIGDATVAVLGGGEASRPATTSPTSLASVGVDDHVSRPGGIHLCAAPLANLAVLVVLFEDESSLTLVRLRMRRARELILRSLEMG